MNVDGNDPCSHGKNRTDLCTVEPFHPNIGGLRNILKDD